MSRYRDGSGPAFPNVCATPAGTSTVCPAEATNSRSASRKRSAPEITCQASSSRLWTCSGATISATPAARQFWTTRPGPRTPAPGSDKDRAGRINGSFGINSPYPRRTVRPSDPNCSNGR